MTVGTVVLLIAAPARPAGMDWIMQGHRSSAADGGDLAAESCSSPQWTAP